MSRYFNAEHISMVAAFLWQQTGGDPGKAIERAVTLQKLAHEKCEKLNGEIREKEDREAFANEFHDQGNATNHKRTACSVETCGLERRVL